MKKLSAADQQAVLAEVPGALRKVAFERDYFRDIVLANASRQRIEKIATSMIDKGIRDGNVQTVADDLEKSASAGSVNIDAIEQAVQLVGTDMGKQAAVSDELSGSAGSSDLERFLLG